MQLSADQQIPHSIAVRTLSSDTKMKPKNKNFAICTKDGQNDKTRHLLKTPKTNSTETNFSERVSIIKGFRFKNPVFSLCFMG